MYFSFIHNLIDRKILLQSSGVRNDAVRTELIASGGNWYVRRRCVSVHRRGNIFRNYFFVFVDQFLVVGNLVIQFFQHQRQKSGIIYPPHKLDVGIGSMKSIKHRVESIINPNKFSIFNFQFSIIYFICI